MKTKKPKEVELCDKDDVQAEIEFIEKIDEEKKKINLSDADGEPASKEYMDKLMNKCCKGGVPTGLYNYKELSENRDLLNKASNVVGDIKKLQKLPNENNLCAGKRLLDQRTGKNVDKEELSMEEQLRLLNTCKDKENVEHFKKSQFFTIKFLQGALSSIPSGMIVSTCLSPLTHKSYTHLTICESVKDGKLTILPKLRQAIKEGSEFHFIVDFYDESNCNVVDTMFFEDVSDENDRVRIEFTTANSGGKYTYDGSVAYNISFLSKPKI